MALFWLLCDSTSFWNASACNRATIASSRRIDSSSLRSRRSSALSSRLFWTSLKKYHQDPIISEKWAGKQYSSNFSDSFAADDDEILLLTEFSSLRLRFLLIAAAFAWFRRVWVLSSSYSWAAFASTLSSAEASVLFYNKYYYRYQSQLGVKRARTACSSSRLMYSSSNWSISSYCSSVPLL